MVIFNHSDWPRLLPYVRVTEGRGNVDLLRLPDDLRSVALAVVVDCVACGSPIRCFRARVKSKRARTAGSETERRLFYSATCAAEVDPGCARSKAAKDHKKLWVDQARGWGFCEPSITIKERGRGGQGTRSSERGRRVSSVIAKIDASLQFAPMACREAMLEARTLLVKP